MAGQPPPDPDDDRLLLALPAVAVMHLMMKVTGSNYIELEGKRYRLDPCPGAACAFCGQISDEAAAALTGTMIRNGDGP
jgi:hypothetical protein